MNRDLSIPDLLALDPSIPDQALRFRIGIARLAGWDELVTDGGSVFGASPIYEFPHELPPLETSFDAAVALPLPKGWEWQLLTWGTDIRAQLFTGRYYEDDQPIFDWTVERPRLPAEAYCKCWLKMKHAEMESDYPFHIRPMTGQRKLDGR